MAVPDILPDGLMATFWVGIGTAIGVAVRYITARAETIEKPVANLHIGDATITDMEPIIAMGGSMKRVANALEIIMSLMQEEVNDRKERAEELAREEMIRVREENRRMKEENDAVRERLIRAERAAQGERSDITKSPKG